MASAKLTRTNGTSTNQKKGTFSVWVKRSGLSAGQGLISGYVDSNNYSVIYFDSDDRLAYLEQQSGSTESFVRTTRKFRDVNAWYHIVVALDATQSTSSDRVKLYVNGSQETVLSSTNYPSDTNLKLLSNSTPLKVGEDTTGSPNYFNGMMAHVNFVDGTALTPSSFGLTDSTTGIWKFKSPSGITYGTNGFFLKFDNSANMGLDSSGNSNNLTTSGTIIQNKDTPSNIFATLDVLNQEANANGTTFSNTNSTYSSGGHANRRFYTTNIGASSGKYYCEIKLTSLSAHNLVGISSHGITTAMSDFYFAGSGNAAHTGDEFEYGYKAEDGNQVNNATSSSYGNTYTTNDIIGIAMDLDNNKLYFSKNGVFQNSGVPTSGSTGTGAISISAPASTDTGFYFFAVAKATSSTNTATFQCNFGNGYFGTTAVASAQSPDDGEGIFEYDVPAGYRALCTKSLNEEEYS
tara:strand:+ start:172 stop:1560 length:1389 start_codon:yes stop_codon:yes gene_type:complete